jgi:hypothetical protein
MPIARAVTGGSVQSIFSSASRITIHDHTGLDCRDAKLKMLCIIKIEIADGDLSLPAAGYGPAGLAAELAYQGSGELRRNQRI